MKGAEYASVAVVPFVSYAQSVAQVFNEIGAGQALKGRKLVLIKPNLVESLPPPITTPVECVEAIIRYVRSVSGADVIVAEGCGSASHDTGRCFHDLGYESMARRLGVKLVDLNIEPTVVLRNRACRVFPEFHMPEIAMTHFVISVPVLKAHSLAIMTGAMKNMMGFAPPAHYQQGGHWKKSSFHARMHESIVDLVRYRSPDLSLMDARVGMPEYHLGGKECNPPVNRLVAGFNPVEVDRVSAGLLGLDWKMIPHLADATGAALRADL